MEDAYKTKIELIRELEQLRAQNAMKSQQLSAALNRQAELDLMKNHFMKSISHELRSPLGIIYGHAEMLASENLGSLNDEQRQSSEIIMRRVIMLTNLVDDLAALFFADNREFRNDEIDTTLFAYSLFADYQMRAQELEIILKAEIEASMPWMRGDSTHLRRVFDNLVANAFKFTPAGGCITLRVNNVGETIQFEVTDNGKGIPKDQLTYIFERFYQVESSATTQQNGMGLGLALAKEIVEAHQGTISAHSELTEGSTFTITIPSYFPE